jgi:hypothetical protein
MRRARLLGALSAVLAATIFTVPQASADVLPNNPIISDYSSDPDARWCWNGSAWGLCLYTSRDDRPNGWNYGTNPYPMSKTRMYFLPQGANPGVQSNWQAQGSTVNSVPGVILNETAYIGGTNGFVQSNTNHLWAPTGMYNGIGKHLLLVPDLTNPSQQHTSSRIGVSVSSGSNPGGPYTFQGKLNLDSGPNSGYASDPSLSIGGTFPFLVYANGDFDNCGKISMAEVSFEGTSIVSGPYHFTINPSTAGPYSITGVPTSLRGCNNNNDYYLEGPEHFTRYIDNVGYKHYLMFAAKAGSVPSGCNASGEPNSANEAIAYAMSDDLEGPYAYKGVIMCGSNTEWTNQASIVQDWGKTNNNLFFYHDGASGNPHTRKVHAECFRFNSDGTIPHLIRTNSTTSSRWVGNCWDD